MRTYSHAILTHAAIRCAIPSKPRVAAWGAAGALLPDLSAIIGAAWLMARRSRFGWEEFQEEACARKRFGAPDAALHSLVPVGAALAAQALLGARTDKILAFLLGWAGHALTDALTHGEDARPPLWPLSAWRLESPVSYRDRERHGRLFTLAEHATVLLVIVVRLRDARRYQARSG